MDLDGRGRDVGGIDVNFFGDAIEIAGLGVPVLAFAFVHGELDGVAVGAMEGGVFVEDALDPVIAGGDVAKICGGIAESVVVNEGGLAGGEGVDVRTENLLRFYFDFEDLVARLGIFGGRDDDVDAAVERSGAKSGVKRDGEARLRGGSFFARGLRSGGENCGARRERDESRERVDGNSTGGVARDAANNF
jgi:hypothetical protein